MQKKLSRGENTPITSSRKFRDTLLSSKILPEKEPLVFRDASFFRVFPRFVPVNSSLQMPCLTGSDFGSQSLTNIV